ncbi:MAG: glycoside hydrolase family 2 TIM barrel-domain containing protein [Telluria sp.]
MFRFERLLAVLMAAILVPSAAMATPVHPSSDASFRRTLNGDWSFKYVAGSAPGADAAFTSPRFDVSAWPTIPVPANWELQGFAEPVYGDHLKDGLGLYRRSFRVPAAWQGRKVFLRFEGVAFGYELWVNGKKAGASSASAFNRHTFDVTDFLLPERDADNLVAVRVATRPHGVEFDLNDDWSLSGIYRDVTLFAVPRTHIQDVTTSTRLTGGAAELKVDVDVSQAEGEVRAVLLGPDGRSVGATTLRHAGATKRSAVIRVAKPRLWTAETPSLYRLRLTAAAGGKVLHTVEERIGLREVSIADGVLLLNGRPIKLRGVNHHDLEPKTGRAVTEAQMRQDLTTMKRANVNYLRSSHYPPHPRLLELCDEMGFYVMDEVSIGHGEDKLDRPDYRENILARVGPTIQRDKNRPSVLIWSIGNENPINDAEQEAGRLARELDPTRPITYPKIGSYFAANYQRIPPVADLYAPHYPSNATLEAYTRKLERPAILTEYAHALGLATDRMQEQWDLIQASPRFAGASAWHFHDQGILRTSARPVDTGKRTQLVWLDSHRYYDTNGLDGADGLVYADRTPQVDYWQMRKVYAPVQFRETEALVKPGPGSVALTVENRHDFRSLAGIRLLWSLQRNGKDAQQGQLALRAAARAQETVRIPLTIPADAGGDVLALAVRAVDEQGLQLNERVLRLKLDGAGRVEPAQAWSGSPQGTTAVPVVTEDAAQVTVALPQWVLTVQRATGAVTIRDRAGKLLVAGIQPHSGRKPTMAEALGSAKSGLWLSSMLTRLDRPAIALRHVEGKLRIAISGRYLLEDEAALAAAAPQVATRTAGFDDLMQGAGAASKGRPGAALGEGFHGGYTLDIDAAGAIAVSYEFVTVNAQGALSEAGLSVLAPAGADDLRWIGQGPYAGYPGKDRLNEFGIHRLHRDDLRFQGNRRATELALLTSAGGAGFAFAMPAADVAVERDGKRTLLSHNALIGGLGNKGTAPETRIVLDQPVRIAGAFTLYPLAGAWPAPLARWFGAPGTAQKVFKPFHHSYDQ